MGGREPCGWLSAFPGTGHFPKAFRPLVSGIPTMVWALNEGQGCDRIPHPEPSEYAAAEMLRNRRHCCPSGRSHAAVGPGPFEGGSGTGQKMRKSSRVEPGGVGDWQSGSTVCGSSGRAAAALAFKDCSGTQSHPAAGMCSVRSLVTKGVGEGRWAVCAQAARDQTACLHPCPGSESMAEWTGTRVASLWSWDGAWLHSWMTGLWIQKGVSL